MTTATEFLRMSPSDQQITMDDKAKRLLALRDFGAKRTTKQDGEMRALIDEIGDLNHARMERMSSRQQIEAALRSGDLKLERTDPLEFDRNYYLESGSTGDDYDRDPFRDSRDSGFHGKNPWDLSSVRTYGVAPQKVADEFRSRALSAIEKMPGASHGIRSAATEILENLADYPDKLAQQILLTSSPQYMRAWGKVAMHQSVGVLDPDEHRAWAEVEKFRAMSLTDSSGGYLVPFQLDPTVIITSNGSRNDIRLAAREVIATGDVWNGVSSAAVSWSWDTEGSEVSDDSPTLASPTVPVYTARGFVPISIEAYQDAANITQEVGRLFAEGKDDLESVAFATGSGSNQPTGIVTALAGTSSEINAAADDTFAIADVRSLYNALPSKWRKRAAWLANNSTYTTIRGFDTAGGGGFWRDLNGDRPEALLGKRVLEAEAMDATVTTSGAVSNFLMVFGDFENYVVADRIGMTVELIPHLFHTSNNRPSGQRGWFAWYRVGADSVNDAAFRLLDVPSAG